MPNYNFPQVPAPQTGWQPQGFLGGMMYSDQAENYRKQRALQEVIERAAAQQRTDEAETYRLDKPVRAAKRPQEISGAELETSKNRGRMPFVPQFIQGEVGTAQQQQAAGRKALGTVESEVAAANAAKGVETAESGARMATYPGANAEASQLSQWLIGNPATERQRQLQKEQQQDIYNRTLDQEELQQLGLNQRAQLQADTQKYGYNRIYEGRQAQERPPQAIARLNRELRKDPMNEGARRELTYYLNAEFANDFQKDMRGAMMATQAISDPKIASEYEMYETWRRAEYFDRHGMDNPIGQLSFDEFRWVNAAMQSNPGMPVEQIIEEGRKRRRIKSQKKQQK